MKFIRTYKIEIVLAVLALLVHLLCFWFVTQASGSVLEAVRADDGFFELAQNIRAGNGFSWSAEEPYAPNAMRTPAYPYVLAALIAVAGVTGTALIQLVAASLLPVLGMHIAQTMTRSRKIAVGTGVVLALDPTLALLSFQFYTETLFLLLFFLWLIVSLSYLRTQSLLMLLAGAVLLGCAILVRASVQYLPFLFALFLLWKFGKGNVRKSLVHAGIYLAVVGAILAPWVLRNIEEFGVAGLSAQSPFVLYTNLAPAVLSVANGNPFEEVRDAFLSPAEFKGDAITLANGAQYTARAFEVVTARPAATLFVASKSLFTFFTNDGFYALLVRIGLSPQEFLPLLIVARLVWIAITLSALAGALLYLHKERLATHAVLLVLLVAYFALTSTIAAFGTNPRYRLPVDPVILALAGLGGIYLLKQGRYLAHRAFSRHTRI